MKKILPCIVILLACLISIETTYLIGQEPLDGRNRIFNDAFLENLVGDWKLTRKIRGQFIENTARAEWVLSHQFLRLHMKDPNNPPSYEAIIFIGYDNTSKRYVAHWIDVFGGRFSETLGYGTRSGNSLKFVFEYPDGPLHNTFTWNSEKKTWTFLMQSKDKTGEWKIFAEDNLERKPNQVSRLTEESLKERTRMLLDFYGKKDVQKIMQLFDEENVLMMGADTSEVATTKANIEKLLRDDFKLWNTSRFGEFRNFYANISEKTATVFFDVPWEAKTGGQSRKFLIRFAIVWQKAGSEWKLAQIMNAVPTAEQSAGDIIEQMRKKPS